MRGGRGETVRYFTVRDSSTGETAEVVTHDTVTRLAHVSLLTKTIFVLVRFTGSFRFGSLAIYTGRRHWIVDQALGQV